MKAEIFRDRLCGEIAKWGEVLGVAQTGDINAPLVPGKSDIDIFVLCSRVPDKALRKKRYTGLAGQCSALQMEVCNDEIWGCGDIFTADGIDIMPMYFSAAGFTAYIDEVLQGRRLHAEGRFYPIGRLATVEAITPLHDSAGEWARLIEKASRHPRELMEKWFAAQSELVLDEEDLGRVLLRREVLFYHQVLENALDHFLQALFALNGTYFPSRKRTEAAIDGFAIKPENCMERLLSVIELGARRETLELSVAGLRSLAGELFLLHDNKQN